MTICFLKNLVLKNIVLKIIFLRKLSEIKLLNFLKKFENFLRKSKNQFFIFLIWKLFINFLKIFNTFFNNFLKTFWENRRIFLKMSFSIEHSCTLAFEMNILSFLRVERMSLWFLVKFVNQLISLTSIVCMPQTVFPHVFRMDFFCVWGGEGVLIVAFI